MLYKAWKKVVNFFDDYSTIKSQAKHASLQGEGLKILTPEKIPQRLRIAPAEVKASNISESLLNGIQQIIYSLYPAKEITKKVHNNIMKIISFNSK